MQAATYKSETKSLRRTLPTAKAPQIASVTVPDTLAALHVNPEKALTHGEVETCRKEYGYNEIDAFSFLILLYLAVFSVVSAPERRWFWATMTSKSLIAVLTADALVGTVLALVGLLGLTPLPWWQMIAIFTYAMVSCLVVNDAVKVLLIKRLVPTAVA